MVDLKPPSAEEMLISPEKGDMLCYNGQKWCVARRNGQYYPVPDPDIFPDIQFEQRGDTFKINA